MAHCKMCPGRSQCERKARSLWGVHTHTGEAHSPAPGSQKPVSPCEDRIWKHYWDWCNVFYEQDFLSPAFRQSFWKGTGTVPWSGPQPHHQVAVGRQTKRSFAFMLACLVVSLPASKTCCSIWVLRICSWALVFRGWDLLKVTGNRMAEEEPVGEPGILGRPQLSHFLYSHY